MYSKVTAVSPYRDLSCTLDGCKFQFRGGRYSTTNSKEIEALLKYEGKAGYNILERISEQPKDSRDMKRAELIELAKRLGFKGNPTTEKNDTLIDFIKEVGGK